MFVITHDLFIATERVIWVIIESQLQLCGVEADHLKKKFM